MSGTQKEKIWTFLTIKGCLYQKYYIKTGMFLYLVGNEPIVEGICVCVCVFFTLTRYVTSLRNDLCDFISCCFSEFQKPLFKQGVTSMASLKSGSILTGRVLNVTHFGAFVDIGVEKNGLIHVSKMNPRRMGGKRSVELGDKVEVKVLSIEEARGRISLELLTLM